MANPQQTWQDRKITLSEIDHWHLSGRVAVTQGDEAWSLSLDWQQQGDDYRIQLHGLFGAGRVQLVGNADGVLLKDSDDQVFYADTPEALLLQQTGVHMPVAGLRYWVRGLVSPTQATQPDLDPQGRLAYLEDAQWQVKFRRYMQVSGLDLPAKVFIKKPATQIDVRLVVDEWQLGTQ